MKTNSLWEDQNKIETIRARLHALVAAKSFNMQDTEVLSLSDEMDRLIVAFEKARQADVGKAAYKQAM